MSDMIEISGGQFANLRKWNLGLALLHAAQAAILLILAGDFAITFTSAPPDGPPGTRVPQGEGVFDLPIGIAVAVFLALAAFDHLLTATALKQPYEADLRRGINRFRWVEYSISATLMVVLIASYSGITELAAVFAIICANVSMVLFGWLQEKFNPPGRTETTMLPFWFGTFAGLGPWVGIAFNTVRADEVPVFVYGIIAAQSIFFFSFGLNQWLQYRKVGKWTSYVFGEKTYLVLSLVAKSVLAWQIFGGSLATAE